MRRKISLSGFTLLEIMISVAVVGILVAVAFPLYRNYQTKARASDIVVKYDAVRAGIGAELAQGSVDNCTDLTAKVNPDNLRDPYARLAIGFQKGTDGYRAVFAVCAESSQQGALGVAVAREAHGVFTKTNRIEQGAVLTDSLASFAVPLSAGATTVCKQAPANPPVQCGIAQAPAITVAPPSTVTPPTTVTTPTTTPVQAPAQSATPQPLVCDPGKEKVTVPASVTGTAFDACMPVCPAGQTRDAQLRCVGAVANQVQAPQNPPEVTCKADEEKVVIPGTLTSTGKPLEGCLKACPPPQTRDASLRCVAPVASQPQPVQTAPSGSTSSSMSPPGSVPAVRQGPCSPGYRPNPQGHCVPDHRGGSK